ncbi:CHRD domain-containing protein [Halorussus salinisoli]|uniref:CHRD domain-containing protein n=1 Tax=Halorussus salinisoli TaxID=2558242 RepID=UPI002A90DD8C|nr:CHRD domain-containing protein [Halorussus salinisoli]
MIDRREFVKLGALASVGLVDTAGAQETTTTQMADGETVFVAALSGGNQMPTVETDATGLALFAADEDGVDYALAVANVENMLMAHIHAGGPDESGPVAVWLDPSVDAREPELREGTTNGITTQGTITSEDFVGPLEGESLDALLEMMRTGEAYVNVHTEQNQAGEIRGQTRPVGGLLEDVL